MSPESYSPFVLPGLAEIAGRYQGFIIDLWGVIHDGKNPYPRAVETLDRLRTDGGRVCLLSNSPRRLSDVAARLEDMGVGSERYDHLVTSGEVAFQALIDPPDPWHAALGPRYLHLGPPLGFGLLAGLTQEQVNRPEEADFLLATGTDAGQIVEDYAGVLADSARRGLPMICANPDLIVNVGQEVAVCAGTLARLYEALGGEVCYHGKPHPGVYRRCLDHLRLDPSAVLAVGDSLHTDVAGANAASIDVAFAAGGIHRRDLGVKWGKLPMLQSLEAFFAEATQQPNFVIPCFAW